MPKQRKFPKGIYRTQRPRMNNRNGKTWDYLSVILPDGETIKGHFDSTWGHNFYFVHDNKWYRGGWEFDSGKCAYLPTPDLRIQPYG